MARHDYTQPQLQALLDGWVQHVDLEFAIVVDVGQGNLNVLCNDQGVPYLYFDLGGGMSGSAYTFPEPDHVFCYSLPPNFLLSHWDGDHYRAATEEHSAGNLNGSEWLAPTQEVNRVGCRLGLTDQAKAVRTNLAAAGDLYRWPDDPPIGQAQTVASITSGRHRVIKVNGGDLNNHGLALRVASPHAAGAEYMLFVGDATYQPNTFVHGADQQVVGLVASHHGADVGVPADIPRPQAGGVHTLANSYGCGNHYGHPSTTGVNAYTNRNWQDNHRVDSAGAEADAEFAGPRGNSGLLWRTPNTLPGKIPAHSTHAVVNRAAVGLLATGAAELEVSAPTILANAAHANAVIVGAAYKAAMEAIQPAAAQVAGTLLNVLQAVPAPHPPRTLEDYANNDGVVPAGPLQDALQSLPATADNPNLTALAHAIVDAVLTSAAFMQKGVTNYAVNNAGGGVIGSQARAASLAAWFCTAGAVMVGPSRAAAGAHPNNAVVNGVVHAAQAIGAVAPTAAEVRSALGTAVGEAYSRALGHTAAGFGAELRSRNPSLNAHEIAGTLAPIRDDVKAGIAAAAAMAPAAPVNPEAGVPANVPAINDYARHAARVATLAALLGQAAGAGFDDAARAGVAAGRVAYQAALGAPQLGCHRHPRTCPGGPCSLSPHYTTLPY